MIELKKKIQNGITLIALVITIIILLILAGVSINLVLGNNGILNRAEDSVLITKIKEVEEFARISYMERQIDEIVEGKEATIAGVISDLKEQGYTIKQEVGNENNITGIALSEENVIVERNTSRTVTYTLVYGEGTVRYFVEIQGKYYEINFDNGNITISTEEAILGGTTKEPEVTVTSSDSSIIEAVKTEEGKLLLAAKDAIGDVEITVKEINSGTTKKFTATTRILVTSISISPTEKTIKIGETSNLTATVEPSSAIDKTVLWNSSNTNVATVSDSGVVTAVSEGETIITANSTDGSNITSNVCAITVKGPTLLDKVKADSATYYGKKVKGYDGNGVSDWRIFYADDENVFIITTDVVQNSKIPTTFCGLSSSGSYGVYWDDFFMKQLLWASQSYLFKFSPVTPETTSFDDCRSLPTVGAAISQLTDPKKFANFVSDEYACLAIGSPTLNMWVASWNTKYPSEKLYCNKVDDCGYFISGKPMGVADTACCPLGKTEGYAVPEEDNLYFPHKSSVWNDCYGYIMASASARSSNRVDGWYYEVCFAGLVRGHADSGVGCGLRPVVCLKSDVEVIENADGTVTLK